MSECLVLQEQSGRGLFSSWLSIHTAIVDKDKCTGCETCIDECPAAAIALNDGKAKVDKDLCVDCGSCVDVCPSEAITLE